MRLLKILGLAALAGVVAAGVVAQRRRRAWNAYDPDEVRTRLHERFERADADAPSALVTSPS